MHYVVAKPSEAIPPNTNTTHITHKYQPNVTQIHKYHLNKGLIHNPNWVEMIKNAQLDKNGRKLAKKWP